MNESRLLLHDRGSTHDSRILFFCSACMHCNRCDQRLLKASFFFVYALALGTHKGSIIGFSGSKNSNLALVSAESSAFCQFCPLFRHHPPGGDFRKYLKIVAQSSHRGRLWGFRGSQIRIWALPGPIRPENGRMEERMNKKKLERACSYENS